RRPPARYEAVLAVEGTQGAEGGGDQPKVPPTPPPPPRGGGGGGGPRPLSGRGFRPVGGGTRPGVVGLPGGRRPGGGGRGGGGVGGGVEEPDLGAGGGGEAVGREGQPHGALEVVVRQRQLARGDPDGGDLARLVGGHQQGCAELA